MSSRQPQFYKFIPQNTFSIPKLTFYDPELTFLLPENTFLLPGFTFLQSDFIFFDPKSIFSHPDFAFFLPENTFLQSGLTFLLPINKFCNPKKTEKPTITIETTRHNYLQPTAMLLTHAYVHLLADVHLAGFAPAFTLSQCDSEYARKPQDAHSVPRSRTSVKIKFCML